MDIDSHASPEVDHVTTLAPVRSLARSLALLPVAVVGWLVAGPAAPAAAQSGSTGVTLMEVRAHEVPAEVVEARMTEGVDSLVRAALAVDKDDRLDAALAADSAAKVLLAFRPGSADAHQWRAITAGLLSELVGARDKIHYGRISYEEAAKAVEMDDGHSGAHHVLGRVHAGVMRLGWLTRFIAGKMGLGEVLDQASWEEALYHLDRAVELSPEEVTFRLELALVLRERDRHEAAREHLAAILDLPSNGPADEVAKERAQGLLSEG